MFNTKMISKNAYEINQSIKPTKILGNSIQVHPNNQGGSSNH